MQPNQHVHFLFCTNILAICLQMAPEYTSSISRTRREKESLKNRKRELLAGECRKKIYGRKSVSKVISLSGRGNGDMTKKSKRRLGTEEPSFIKCPLFMDMVFCSLHTSSYCQAQRYVADQTILIEFSLC